MTKQSFLLVSLKEDKAKELAKVISNDSCRKILDYLSEKKDATETKLAQKLNLPISTVHYNLQHLIKSGIVTVEEFHYSEKGKEVNHYKLANKYIIIAPKTTFGIKEKLRSVLPVALLALVGAGFIQLYTKYFRPAAFGAMKAAPAAMEEVVREVPATAPLMEEGAKAAIEQAPEVTQELIQAAPNYALWFLIGAFFAIVLYLIISKIREK